MQNYMLELLLIWPLLAACMHAAGNTPEWPFLSMHGRKRQDVSHGHLGRDRRVFVEIDGTGVRSADGVRRSSPSQSTVSIISKTCSSVDLQKSSKFLRLPQVGLLSPSKGTGLGHRRQQHFAHLWLEVRKSLPCGEPS